MWRCKKNKCQGLVPNKLRDLGELSLKQRSRGPRCTDHTSESEWLEGVDVDLAVGTLVVDVPQVVHEERD